MVLVRREPLVQRPRVQAAQGQEGGPGGRMCERRISVAQECSLDSTQGRERLAVGEQGPVEGHEEPATERVIDIPQAGNHVRHAGREEGPSQAQGSLAS